MRDEERLRAFEGRVNTVALDGAPLFSWALPEFAEVLGTSNATAFRIDEFVDERRFGFVHIHGLPDEAIALYAQYALRPRARHAMFSPSRPERSQRNRVHTLATLLAGRSPAEFPVMSMWHRIGIGGCDQIRVLLCEGERQLGFLGAFRPEPFEEREVRLVRRMTKHLVLRLAYERRLEELDLARAGLVAALDALATEAALVRGDGTVVQANAAARAAFDRSPTTFRADVEAALEGDAGTRFDVRPIALAGPPHYLLMHRSAPSDLDRRLARARSTHRLTSRQCDVLARVVRGDANKLIASELGCSEKTVETHVAFLLRKLRCGGRAELIARFWRDT